MTRSRPNPKRAKPRRGRVIDRKFLTWAAGEPCCITGLHPATSHHLREFGSPKNDRRIIRLIENLHLHEAGMFSIERLGKREFQRHWNINIEAEIAKLRGRYEEFARRQV